MVKISGRKEVWEAVAIAVLTAAGTKLIELIGKEIDRRRDKKRGIKPKKKGKSCDSST